MKTKEILISLEVSEKDFAREKIRLFAILKDSNFKIIETLEK